MVLRLPCNGIEARLTEEGTSQACIDDEAQATHDCDRLSGDDERVGPEEAVGVSPWRDRTAEGKDVAVRNLEESDRHAKVILA